MLGQKIRATAAALGTAVALSIAIPAPAHATYHWASNAWLGPASAQRDQFVWVLAGVYCHELDSAHARKIQVNAVWQSNSLYGSWVDFWTDGYRTYAGQYALAGACRNPHSVGYPFNAHDNYYV